MKPILKKTLLSSLLFAFTLPMPAMGADQDLQQKLDALSKEVEALKQQTKKTDEKSIGRWLTIGGDYRFRVDSLRGKVPSYYQFMGPTAMPVLMPESKPKNDALMTNRFGLNLKAKATKDVTVTTRLLMYKTSGNGTADATNAGFFADRSQILDGTIGHVPSDNTLRVDQVFATWSNIADQPIWFSVGRRPSTAGSPTHVRQNSERPGNGGVPGLLVDYAFDGLTLGYAPDIEALPGAYTKLCYGRGFEAGYSSQNNLRDTDMMGIQIVPIDTDPLRLDFQWNRGFNIFDNPNNVGNQLGDIDWYGLGALSTLKNVGPGNLNLFASTGMSITHPNGNHALLAGAGSPDSGAGLLMNGTDVKDNTGYSAYVGLRYDLPTGTKLGAEYNYGSKYWMPFDPAADDMWTSKLGTRGNVYEAYIIQELKLQPISSYLSKVFFRLGYQYYDFEYTGSNNWVGAPVKIADLTASPMNAQMFAPLKSAQNIYATFEVKF
ncbi:protein of unknown function DUF3373 [Geotalea daltonii FRC-32]|uniref:DUF3373 domain-containing protein n=1 Tax=Geotalea daltonii (strain DSM 22248 / JCM 15807 / FRC-32) TaxID=316067 RepID=B9M9F9_GEODF|nr:DUF3373 domain-containing protein [Geotalea daltonii]ACM20531.1 protein of unknown function DUF3373 [Geotalea daltonii FRC-32]